ncbi:hypothetical protein LZC95_07420 [Pendulispora brunnea]|uniref:Uncharacterized protein n=1 Tax=Pendulispora brunnea TaxID=2905690 RepID=A0ABZ2KDF3_9BACT
MMTCGRAIAILRGLETNQLVAEAKEIDTLIKAGAMVEADPEHFHALTRIHQLKATVPELDDALSTVSLKMALTDIESKLKDEWYRIRTGKEELRAQEQARIAIRYALGRLSDREEGAKLLTLDKQRALIPEGAMYVACPSLGCELYAITHRGRSMRQELEIRLARFEPVEFSAFLKVFDKTSAKMDAFVKNLTALSQDVPPVRKHRAQILVGLVKSGLPAQQATGTYREVLRHNQPPDIAVTCARNVGKFGNMANTMGALQQAHRALVQAGLRDGPELASAAKALLAYEPRESAVARFLELVRGLTQLLPNAGALVYKHAARVMLSAGTVHEIVRRVSMTLQLLFSRRNLLADEVKVAVALAGMVQTEDVLPGFVERFFHLRHLLAHEAGNQPALAADYALECIVCPGTPEEVVSLVRNLAWRITETRSQSTTPQDATAMAVAFAKRFAY